MYRFRILWILALILFTSTISAQYTNVINSNRPGFSESPYSVGSGVYQLETSMFFRETGIDPTFSIPQSGGFDFLFRTSFFKEKLELNANFTFQNDEVAFKNIFDSSFDTSGLSRMVIAGKYMVYEQKYDDKSKEIRSWKERHSFDWKRLIPTVAVYAGVNTDVVNEIHQAGGISPKIGILLQNDLTKDFNVVTNIFYDKFTTDFSEISYIVTATYSMNPRWSTFFENQTIFTDRKTSTNLGSGLAFLYNRNLQFNSSLRFLLDGNQTGYYASFGFSYRLDKHVDDFKEVDAYGNPIEEEVVSDESQKKGFFGKLTGIFKKKDKKAVPKDTPLKQKTIESIRKNSPKILNDSLAKAQSKTIRTRPKRVRIKPSRVRPVKGEKKKKGGLFGFLKKGDEKKEDEKLDEKSINRELKKLEKEQKKLERQQKKEEERKKREAAKKKKKEKNKKKEDENGKENGDNL